MMVQGISPVLIWAINVAYEKLTISDIARKAGVTESAVAP